MSCDLIAYEALQIRNMVKNHHLAKAISDASWARFLWWIEHYANAAVIVRGSRSSPVDQPAVLAVSAGSAEVLERPDPSLSLLWAGARPRP